MVLWWKPQVCPGSPLAQGIFNLVRNLKNVYELSVAHLPPYLRSAKITNSGTVLRNFWFSGWWVGVFFFFRLKIFFKWLVLAVLAVRVSCSAVWLLSFPGSLWSRVESGKHGDKSFGVSLLPQSRGFSAPTRQSLCIPFPDLCSKDSVPCNVIINIFF